MPTVKPGKAKGRRARGTGSIFKAVRRGNLVWIGRKPVGTTATGRTIYREVWAATQGEVVKRLAAVGPAGPDVTLSAWITRWLDTLAVRPRTQADYRDSMTRHLIPSLGHIRVKDVTPGRIEHLSAALKGKGLAPNSVRRVLAHVRIVFGAAVRESIIAVNPVSIARKPKAEKKEIDPFSPHELAAIIRAASAYPPGYLVGLLAGVGCRVGEALALDISDFDPIAGTVSITKTYHRKMGMGPPKSRYGVRTIRVPEVVVPVLTAAVGMRKSGAMFITEDGRRGYERARQAWQSVVKLTGLEYRNMHQLRHSVATALISAGAPLGDVATYLGDTVDTVVKTYLHPAGTDPSLALDLLLGGRKVGSKAAEMKAAG